MHVIERRRGGGCGVKKYSGSMQMRKVQGSNFLVEFQSNSTVLKTFSPWSEETEYATEAAGSYETLHGKLNNKRKEKSLLAV